ncbi:MAG: hypothetical protein QNI89_10080 [Desulfobacterales bacterium]|nr:hypothetical protein [Desulfobacterales bacterium]MDJ0853821.1 hypothetical protein [Desulfobacterales bacterium]MDJ0887641.1 hypothetical protein [Desulfobacterales bacterium]
MRFDNRRILHLAGFVLTFILLGACSSQGPVVRKQGNLDAIAKVAILPFENMSALHGTGTSVRSPITGRVFVTGPVVDQSDRFLTAQLVTHVRRDTHFAIVPSRDAGAIMGGLSEQQGREWPRRRLVARTGQRLGADAVIMGHVYRFRERTGGGAASESPSSVAFDIYLIDCQKEQVRWSAFYDYTQEALSDNLGGIGNFFRRGGRWVRAEELATTALSEIFDDFPRKPVEEQD